MATTTRPGSARAAALPETLAGTGFGVQITDQRSEAPIGSADMLGFGGMTAQHMRVESQEDGYAFSLKGHSFYVALHDMRHREAEVFADDRPVERRRDLRGRLTFVPPGCRTWGWSIPRVGVQSFTALYLDPEKLDADIAVRLKRLPQRPQLYFVNDPLRATLGKVRACLTDGAAPDRLYLESLCTLGALELVQAQQQAGETKEVGALGREIVGRINDYIEANLERDISLADLSGVAGLSRFHFLRAFKRTINETPYQHLLRRRIDRAQTLLRASRMPVSEIALAVGFRNSTRFTTAFRRLLDRTPSEYRQSAQR